jgi:hypothetical protein
MSPARSRNVGSAAEDVEPVKQILPETILRHFARQVAIGGGHDADAHLAGGCTSDRLESPLLQHTQQLALEFQRQLAHFVEKDGAAIGEREPSLAARRRARERALLVPEELALNEGGRNGGAIHRHQRLFTTLCWRRGWRGQTVPCPCRSRPG